MTPTHPCQRGAVPKTAHGLCVILGVVALPMLPILPNLL